MFGLMRRAPRLPYCGTCKTLGAVYGHRSRVLLNHDTVFLAELLLAHTGEPAWSAAYRSFNCVSLPKRDEQFPIALDFAAAATVVLAHFKAVDHADDTGRWKWRAAVRMLSPTYQRAAGRLRAWDFPLDELEGLMKSQSQREAHAESIENVAEPTAAATALFLSHGARLAGMSGDDQDRLSRAGHRFGYLIYVLDAWEDRERDIRSGAFNALNRFSMVDGRAEILRTLAAIESDIPTDLAQRMRANVEERLGIRPRVLNRSCRKPLQQRWNDAVVFAKSMRTRERAGLVKGAAIVATVAVAAFLFPHHARGAGSWKHCMGLGLNLMAAGSLFAFADMPQVPGPGGAAPTKRGGCMSGCGDCCGACACDGCTDCACDGCCSSCDCGGCCDC